MGFFVKIRKMCNTEKYRVFNQILMFFNYLKIGVSIYEKVYVIGSYVHGRWWNEYSWYGT